jgi:hypothetical protein
MTPLIIVSQFISFLFHIFKKAYFYVKSLKMNSEKEHSQKNKVNLKNPLSYEITAEGSLGLLALGAVGIKAWRKKRQEETAKSNNELKK